MKATVLILLPIILAVFLSGGISIRTPQSGVYSSNNVGLVDKGVNEVNNALQLANLVPVAPKTPTTPTQPTTPIVPINPAPVNPTNPEPITDNGILCTHSAGVPIGTCKCEHHILTCQDDQCVKVVVNQTVNNCANSGTFADQYCKDIKNVGLNNYCIGKPVIYLYPTTVTSVDVSVESIGQVVVSDPLYPTGGWKGVEAHPDGTLYYQDEKYRELFYETNVSSLNPPKDGLFVKSTDLEKDLRQLTYKLGLIPVEQDEFIDWWLPRLKDLNSPYILFSILDQTEKDRIDKVNINPKPDTFIDFIAYFKPVKWKTNINPLVLPETPQKRIGFTAVEWGGVIDPK